MNNLYVLRGFELKEEYPIVTLVNGALFWLSYIPFRLVLFPVWLWWFYNDLSIHGSAIPTLTNLELYLYPATNVALFVLSVFWFMKITKGSS